MRTCVSRFFAMAAVAVAAVAILPLALVPEALAQAPKRGGILSFAVVAEPPTTDCHGTGTFAMVHPVAPQYSTLLKTVGPHDATRTVGDLAESWDVAPDGKTYTFRLRKGVKFHDGSDFTSADVKATYARIVNPPPGVISQRKAVHQDIAAIDTPDSHTVVFRLAQANASMMLHFASPFNCVYSAARLAADPQYPEKEVMGTGAFQFVEYRKGSHWKAKRFEGYYDKSRPYLDGYTAYFVKSPAVVAGLRGGQFDAEFRGRTPKEREELVATMGDKVRVVEGPWITNIQFAINSERITDKRVRQALSLALDRWGGSEHLGKISLIKGVSGVFRPGSPFALPIEDLKRYPGYWPDIAKSRAEAKRLLAEAGVPNLKLKLLNRQIGEPFVPAGIFAVDQWRRIGVETEHVLLETKIYFDNMHKGEYDVAVSNVSDFLDDPNAQFNTLLSKAKSGPIAYSRHSDAHVDALYDKQSGILDPVERLKVVHELERYLLDQSYSIALLWYQRIVVNHRKVMGWDLPPSHFLNQQLVDVWLDE